MCNLWKLFKITGGIRRFIILVLLRCPVDALLTFIQASFLQYAFIMMEKENLKGLYIVCILFGIGSLSLFLYNGIVWSLYAINVTKWVGVIRRKLFRHISDLSLEHIEAKPSGEWITRLNADVDAASAMLNQPVHLPHAVVASINICISGMILVMMNPVIFGLIMMFVIPHMLISQLFVAKHMTNLALKVQAAAARNTTDMNSIITCADTAILYNAQGFLLSRFEESSLKLRKENMKMRLRSAIGSGLLPLTGMSGYLVVLLIGGSLISAGTMTFGELTAAFQYRGGMLAGSVLLMNSLINIKTALAGVKRVNETMSMAAED